MIDFGKDVFVRKNVELNYEEFNQKLLEKPNYLKIQCEEEGKFYKYWIEGESVKGVKLINHKNHLEICTSFLANKADYRLINQISSELSLTKGFNVIDETGKTTSHPYTDKMINNLIDDDFFQAQFVIKSDGLFHFTGVHREVFIGKRFTDTFKNLGIMDMAEEVFKIALDVNFKYRGFVNSPYYEVTLDGKNYTHGTTLITNTMNMVISLYDFICFPNGGTPIFITNKILNEILPKEWELLDEYNIAACVLNPKEWNILLSKAKERDLFNQLQSKQYGN